jgi:transcriptional regulator with XRE-family HTH domain
MSSDIGEFLQARRTRVSPENFGLPTSGRRRVQGLRREELAMLAGVSVDYYTRVEQGRADSVSDSVLRAIAEVLGLDDIERAHLMLLARPPKEDSAMPEQHVRAGVRRLLDSMPDVPAFVAGRWQEILATNALAAQLLPDGLHEGSNSARFVFLDPRSRDYYLDWDHVAADTAATLRWETGVHPGDPVLARLIGELSIASPAFTNLWAEQEVQVKTHGTKRVMHPTVGLLILDYETLALPDDSDEILVTYVARDDSSAAALEILKDLARR